MTLRPGRDGDALYDLVVTFDGHGVHRAGSPGDAATSEWLATLLSSHLDVVTIDYDFDRFEWSGSVVADGDAIDHLPLFYEGVGQVTTTDPRIVAVDTFFNFVAPDLDDRINACDAPVLLAATAGATGELVAFNRATELGSGQPVVLVPGRAHDPLRSAERVEVRYEASIEPGRSANVIATGGRAGAPHIVLTTPLTGWFHCAGERGPGVALFADLGGRLADHVRVTMIGASGHELHHAGARAVLDHVGADLRPDAVIHLGASIATGPAAEGFGGQVVQTQLPPDLDRALAPVYADSEQTFAGRPEQWISEAREWVDRSELVLSYTGTFPLFHTPADRVDAATSPERLAGAAARLDDAVDLLLDHLRASPSGQRRR